MIFKLAGSIFLCASGGFVSFYIKRFQKNRLLVLDGFVSLIFYIKGQVDCYSMPISEILSGAPRELLERCFWVEDLGLCEMVDSSRAYLTDEGARLLYCFASEFGSTYRDEQIKRCDYYIEALCEERKNIAQDIPKKSRAYSALAICLSLGLAIMLW